MRDQRALSVRIEQGAELAQNRSATLRAMAPMPTRPTCLPCRVRPRWSIDLTMMPCESCEAISLILLSRPSVRPSVSSATVSLFIPA